MKKVLILTLAISLVVAGIAMATVLSSKHDMRSRVTGNTTTQICVFCHHPHRGVAADGTSRILLWNINGSAATNFPTYNSPTAPLGGDTNLGTSDAAQYSRLCMTCHDGTVADGGFIKGTKEAGASASLGSLTINDATANLGSTLADDHPVDFTYANATGSDIKAKDASTTDPKVIGNVTAVKYPLYNDGSNATMQCATCHDVHRGEAVGIQFMRELDDAGVAYSGGVITASKICRDCHTAK
ncbi:MAG: hypothetical protein HY805_02400 [Nitrospirae bacterium]|nr:hypothetical protein [Nitrospirota bacterium]